MSQNNSESKTVYLITTPRADARILDHAEPCINLFENDLFIKFFSEVKKHIVNIIKKSDKHSSNESLYSALQQIIQNFDANQADNRLDTLRTKYTNGLLNASPEERQLCLFANVWQIPGTCVYITHCLYNEGNLDFKLKSGKHRFLRILIDILSKHNEENSTVKLFAHDKDFFERRTRGVLLTHQFASSNLVKIEEEPLHSIISNKNAYISHHGDDSMFYKHFLNWEIKDTTLFAPRLEDFLTLSSNFVQISIENIDEENKYIYIHLDFKKGLEFQFLSVFSQIVHFNRHAWKSNINFVPLLFRVLLTEKCLESLDDKTKSETQQFKKIIRSQEDEISLRELTQLPLLISSGRPLTEQPSTPGTCTQDDCTLIELEPRARYLDSSIWMNYTESDAAVSGTPVCFPSDFAIYKSSIAREIREFNARLCDNSRLIDSKTGHGKRITPFPFFSESNNSEHADKLWRKIEKKIPLSRLDIRVLLVDDKAENSTTDSVGKLEIITSILKKDFTVIKNGNKNNDSTDNNKTKATIYIECAVSVVEAIEKLAEKKFDIILLDYLLEHEVIKEKNNNSFGTDLLQLISNSLNLNPDSSQLVVNSELKADPKLATNLKLAIEKRGPLEKFWIFFISTFSTAVREDMRVRNFHYNEPYWHIERGACPAITPELFRSNFYYLLNRQISELTNIKATGEQKNIVTLVDFIKVTFEAEDPRTAAINNFSSFLHLKSHYKTLSSDFYFDIMKKDERNGSYLTQSLFPDLKHYGNAFWEHLQHLIYLVAFGNSSQWDMMWDEFRSIKPILSKADSSISDLIQTYLLQIKRSNNC